MKPLLFCLLTIILSACGGGSSNPFGSFGSLGSGGSMGSLGSGAGTAVNDPLQGVDTTGEPGAVYSVNDGSVLLPVIKAAAPEAALRGMILRVTALAPVQGYHDAALYPLDGGKPDANGMMRFEMRAIPPLVPPGTGSERSREIVVAQFIRDRDLVGLRGFIIIGAQNTMTIRR